MDGVQAMEDWLETIHHYRHGREGYQMFKLLGPNIQVTNSLLDRLSQLNLAPRSGTSYVQR